MERRPILRPGAWPVFLCSVLLAACGNLAEPRATVEPTVRAAPPVMPANQDSWILVDLPPDATQLQHGAEIYRLVCSACHADSGEGLTDAWRATWNPKDQNCWQSKCHAANHPPDGFELPISPAVAGGTALRRFESAADLRDFIQARMPWQDPNSLTEEEGWAVTAYVIQLNGMNPEPELNAENAANFPLHRKSAQPAVLVGAGVLVGVALFLAMRAVRQARKSAGN